MQHAIQQIAQQTSEQYHPTLFTSSIDIYYTPFRVKRERGSNSHRHWQRTLDGGTHHFSSPTLLEHASLCAGQAQRGQRRNRITQSLVRMGEREPKMKWKRVPVHAQNESNDKHGNVHDKPRKDWSSNMHASLSVFPPTKLSVQVGFVFEAQFFLRPSRRQQKIGRCHLHP